MADDRYPIADDRVRNRVRLPAAAALVLAATFGYPKVAARQMPAAPVYAITGAKIVTGTSTIDKGTVVMRNGLIEEVGANVAVPADAVVVDGSNLTAYPGLIDMTNTTAVETSRGAGGADATGEAAGQSGRGGRGAAPSIQTWAEADRAKR